ncbi:MAG: hypothetical protein IE928_09165 [Gammaproteobacteria bacterium]|nr:hypothetical protein [Gammaproteobacteria bacterium]
MSVQHNIDKVADQLNATFKQLDDDLLSALKKTVNHIQDETEKGADKHTVTGALRNAVFSQKLPDGWLVGIDEQKAPHAEFVHFPTRPHLIKPKAKKALRWPNGGAFAFAKAVNHPGYKGDPFFHDAIDSGMRFLDNQIQQLKLR